MDWLTTPAIITVLKVILVVAALSSLACQFAIGRQTTPQSASPSAWFWSRWGAVIALISGWAVVVIRSAHGVHFAVPSMTLFVTAILILCIQWFNVWFVAWPTARTSPPGQELPRTRATLRLNVTLTLPLLLFLGASAWGTSFGGEGRWKPSLYWASTVAAYGALGLAALTMPRLLHRVLRPLLMTLLVGAALPLLILTL